MSFPAAIGYLRAYQQKHIKALNNEQSMDWFLDGVDALPKLMNETFDSSPENNTWEGMYTSGQGGNQGEDIIKLQGIRKQIAFVCGCRRDLRMQFAAQDGHIPRGPLDWDRFMMQRLLFARNKLLSLQQKLDHNVGTGSKM